MGKAITTADFLHLFRFF